MTLFKRIIITLMVLTPLSGMCAAMKVGDLIAGNSLIVTNGSTAVLFATNGSVTLTNLILLNSTNQITFGATNIPPPSSASASPTKWVSVRVSGDAGVYGLPLYQSFGVAAGGGSSETIIAASNSPTAIKAIATYLCTGTNDQGIFQLAISNNPSVLIAPGDYWLSKTNVSSLDACVVVLNNNNWRLRGSGGSTRLHVNTHRTNSMAVFDIRGCTNITISDFYLDCGADGSTSYLTNEIGGIDFTSCENVLAENLYLKNGQGGLIAFDSSKASLVKNVVLDTTFGPHILSVDATTVGSPWILSRDITFDSINVTNDMGGAAKLENCRGCTLVNSTFAPVTNAVVLVIGSNDTNDTDVAEGVYTVANNHFYNGIQFNGSHSNSNSGIIFANNLVEGYLDIGASSFTNQFDSLLISGNTLLGGGTNLYGIVSDSSCGGNLHIIGNSIIGYTNAIMIAQQPRGGFAKCSIRDNQLTAIVQIGIQLSVGSPSIQNNLILATSFAGQDTSYRGISIDDTTNAVINANQIYDFHEGLYVNGSSQCYAQGNYFAGTNTVNAINEHNGTAANSNNVYTLNFFNFEMVSGKNLTVTSKAWSSTYISPINNNYRMGADSNQKNYLTPNHDKLLQITAPSYASTDPDVGLLGLDVFSSSSFLAIGTGSSAQAPLTRVTFYLGSGTAGSAGTAMGRITDSGWCIGADSAPTAMLDVRGTASMTSTLAVGGLATFTNGISLLSFNATSNYVWTCTNASTGQGEWRTTSGFQPASANLTNWSLIPTGSMANVVSTTFLTNWANAVSNLAETKQLGSANLTNWSLIPTGAMANVVNTTFLTNWANAISNLANTKQFGSSTLTNLSGTGAITNLIGLSLSNATIKPVVFGGVGSAAGMTNTTGQIYGLEAGTGTSLTPNGSNITIATTLTTVSTNANQFGASVQLTIKNLAFLTNANFFGATNFGDFTNDGKIFSTGTFTNGGAVNILGGVTNWGAVETRGNATNAGWLAIVGGFTNNGAMLIGGSITNAGRVDTAGGMTNYSSFKVLGTADFAGAVTNESRLDTAGGATNWIGAETKGTLYASSNLLVKAGQGTSNAWVGGRIFIDASTQTTNHSGAAAYTNLFTCTVSGNTLTNTGDELEFYLAGMMRLGLANTNGFKCIYGSQTVFDTGLNTASNCPWSAKIKITRTGLSAQRIEAVLLWELSLAVSSAGNGAISGYATNLTAAQANGATNIFVFQGQSRVAAALTNDYRSIFYWPGLN